MELNKVVQSQGRKTIIFDIKENPGDSHVKLSGGEDLGLVQAVEIRAEVGQLSTAKVYTKCTEGRAEVLQKNTELIVTFPETYDQWSSWIKNDNYFSNFDENKVNVPGDLKLYGFIERKSDGARFSKESFNAATILSDILTLPFEYCLEQVTKLQENYFPKENC